MILEFIITAVVIEKIILAGVIYNIYHTDTAENNSIKVSKLKKLPYDECPICLEEFCDNDHINILECDHCFHSNCITEWKKNKTFDKNNNVIEKLCPICRKKIKFKRRKVLL